MKLALLRTRSKYDSGMTEEASSSPLDPAEPGVEPVSAIDQTDRS
jgi:hypothetical protein